MENPKWTAATIQAARNSLNITQRTMAAELGCRQQTISEWEVGQYSPKNAYQTLLTQYFDRKLSEFEAKQVDTEITHAAEGN